MPPTSRPKSGVRAASLSRARKDPAFEANHRNNPAFALGVQAALYVHENRASKTP